MDYEICLIINPFIMFLKLYFICIISMIIIYSSENINKEMQIFYLNKLNNYTIYYINFHFYLYIFV